MTKWTNSDALFAPFHEVLVYSAGVMGSLYAARLRQTGVDVTLRLVAVGLTISGKTVSYSKVLRPESSLSFEFH